MKMRRQNICLILLEFSSENSFRDKVKILLVNKFFEKSQKIFY